MTKRKPRESHAANGRRGKKKAKNGLAGPSRKLYDKVTVKDPVCSKCYREITEILRSARTKAYRASNFFMVEAYWNIGRMIVEEERQNKARSRYGEQ
jgi:hypothetical protein